MRERAHRAKLTGSALALLVALASAGVMQAQAPTVTSETPIYIPQTNPNTLVQPTPYTAHFIGTGFLATTTASFSWSGGTGTGTVYYVSGSSIQVRLPTNISPTATSVTPTLCNGGSCVNAPLITLFPATPTSGTMTANPNPSAVGQPTVVTAVIAQNSSEGSPVPGAPSGSVPVTINNVAQGSYPLVLDKTTSYLYQGGMTTLSSAPNVAPLTADFNGDGIPDLIFYDVNSTSQIHVVLSGSPGGSFQNETVYPMPNGCSAMSSLAVGDFNKDGFADYVIDCYPSTGSGNLVFVYLSNGDGTFAAPVQVSGTYGETVLVGDFNKDGTPDLMVVGNLPTGQFGFVVFTGNGNGTFTASTTSVENEAIDESQFVVADVDGDGYPDIIGLNNSGDTTNSIEIFQNNANASYGTGGNPTYTIPLNPPPDYLYTSLVTGDFNHDGLPDLAVGFGQESTTSTYGVLTALNTSTPGNISYATPVATPAGNFVEQLAVGDFNGDGYDDLVYTTDCSTDCDIPTGTDVNFLESSGSAGTFTNSYPNLTIPIDSTSYVITANLNGDTYSDLMVVGATVYTTTTAPLTSYITSGSADAAFTLTPALSGTDNIAANYPGDVNFAGTTMNLALPVSGPTVTVSVGSSTASAVYGQPVMLSSTVSPPVAGATPTGTVSFYAGMTLLSTVPMVNGSASLTTSTIATGEYAITASYSGDTNYGPNASTTSAPLTVTQATPVVSWTPTPTTIAYGTTLVASQLDATAATTYTASVPGTFQYTPALGAMLGAGTQTLKVTFTPTDATDYAGASGTTSIIVTQVTPTITWSNPADITVGTPLSGTQLDATASFGSLGTVAGVFTYTPASGAVLAAGANQTLSVGFAPTDTTDYTAANDSVTINVDQPAPTVTSELPTSIPQTNPNTMVQPAPYTVHFSGTGFLSTTTASFSWAGGSGAGTVYYASASSIQVRLPSNISPTATSVTPTLCNGTGCVQATAITLTPPTPTTGTISATPNPATVGQGTEVTAIITPTTGGAAVPGAPSGAVPLTINGNVQGYYSLMLDKTNSSLVSAGTATFSAAPEYNVNPLVADFNGDGVPDLIFYDNSVPTQMIHVELGGAPAGSFQKEILYSMPAECTSINSLAVGDFNKDGFTDYVVDCTGSGGTPVVDVYLSKGDGTFAAPVQVTGAYGTTVVVGDLNNDGTADLLVAGRLGTGTCLNVCVTGFAVFTGNGDGTFTASTTSTIANETNESTLLVTDVDGDGYPDIVGLNNNSGNTNAIDIFKNNANASYGTAGAPTYSVPLSSGDYFYSSLVTGDFNLDGLPDIALVYGEDTEPLVSGILTVLNTSTAGTISYAAPVLLPQATDVTNVAVGDVNGDGYADLAFTSECTANCAESYYNNVNFLISTGPKGTFANSYPNLTIPSGSANTVMLAKLNGDSYADVLVLDAPPVSATTQQLTSYITSGSADVAFALDPQQSGNLTISETYAGDVDFSGTTVSLSLPVNGALSTVTVASSTPAAVYGQSVTLSSTVIPTGTVLIPSGTISFYSGTTLLGTAPLMSGAASLPINTLPAAAYAITASYSGDTNFAVSLSSNSAPLTVTQATPVVSWAPTPTSITYGTGLAATQLDATVATTYTANVPGTLVYKPVLGTVLGAGTQTLTVAFTPTDTVDFTKASGTTTITVTQATPVITWSAPAAIVMGTPLSGTQLNATANFGSQGTVAGTFTYTPALGAVLGVGNNQALDVQFAPTDATDYTTATGSTTINVIALGISQLAPASLTIGAGATPVTLTGTGFLANSVVNINGSPTATTYISPTSLSIVVPAASLLTTQSLNITVTDPTQAETSALVSLPVVAPPAQATFTAPTTVQPAQQPAASFTLTTAYPVPITGTVTLTFAGTADVDDPSIQFATGGRTQTFTIPANSTTTPTIQFQTGTDAGTITLTLSLNAAGQVITPPSIVPLVIAVPVAVPTITSFTLTRNGNMLTANIMGYSNTRDVSQATFNFTAASGASITNPQVIVPATTLFGDWFSNATSDQYGSSFLYTQQFQLDNDASTVGSVTVTLTNSVGASVSATAQ